MLPIARQRACRLAIVGAGPIGLDAALYAAGRGHDVHVYERDRVGSHVLAWGHVRMFSPWALDRSREGARALAAAGVELAPDDEFPTGAEYVRRYLAPLAGLPALAGRIHEGTAVVAVAREHAGKSAPFGAARRSHPLRLLVEDRTGERAVAADAVIDCSGTYGNPRWMGSGGIPAPGERALRGRITYALEDLAGAAGRRLAGRRVLLVGAGHSAATALDGLLGVPAASILWVTRTARAAPYASPADDPLPERARLAALGNRLASGADPRVERLAGASVERVATRGAALDVTLRAAGRVLSVEVDHVAAHVGHDPERSIYAELQVHECYATLGPMALSAALLAASGTDCLAQPDPGPDALEHPEPDFFIAGAKSHGRIPSFLLRDGFRQVRQILRRIESGRLPTGE